MLIYVKNYSGTPYGLNNFCMLYFQTMLLFEIVYLDNTKKIKSALTLQTFKLSEITTTTEISH